MVASITAFGFTITAVHCPGESETVAAFRKGFALSVLRNPELKSHLSKGALACAATHQTGPILEDLLAHIGLSAQQTDDTAAPRRAATHIKAS